MLTRHILDDGRGFARSKVFKHGHEEATGRTSSIGQHNLCVSTLPLAPYPPHPAARTRVASIRTRTVHLLHHNFTALHVLRWGLLPPDMNTYLSTVKIAGESYIQAFQVCCPCQLLSSFVHVSHTIAEHGCDIAPW